MPDRLHHESLYRGPQVLAKLASLPLAICGAGAVGSNLADNLVRHGAAKLRVIDHDRVEPHNISTQIYGEADVGVWKVEALRNALFRACGVEIESVRKTLDARNARTILKETGLIIDAFDNTASRQCVQDHARAAGTPCLHVGLFEDYCEVIWDEEYRVPRQVIATTDVCEYPLARNLVLLATTIASEVILQWLADSTRRSLSATLRDWVVQPVEKPAGA